MNPWILLLPVLLIAAVLLCWRIIRRPVKPSVYRRSPDGTFYCVQGNLRRSNMVRAEDFGGVTLESEPHTIIGQGEYAKRLYK